MSLNKTLLALALGLALTACSKPEEAATDAAATATDAAATATDAAADASAAATDAAAAATDAAATTTDAAGAAATDAAAASTEVAADAAATAAGAATDTAAAPTEAPAAPTEPTDVTESADIKPVYEVTGPADPRATALCTALFGLPSTRKQACCAEAPGTTAASVVAPCAGSLTAALALRDVVVDDAKASACIAARTAQLEGCAWVGAVSPHFLTLGIVVWRRHLPLVITSGMFAPSGTLPWIVNLPDSSVVARARGTPGRSSLQREHWAPSVNGGSCWLGM